MRINQRDKIVSLLQAENAMTQRELAEAIYGDSSHSPNIYSVLMSLVNKKIVMRLDEHPARYSLYKMSTIQQATKQDCVEQSSSNVNGPPSITMSSEYAVDLIRAYFEQTAIDPHSRYFSWEHCYKAFLMHRNEKDDPLVGISAKDLCKEQNLALLEDIGKRIYACYAEDTPASDRKVNAASDTLITKILLGTLGCVPAYDRFYKESVKKHHISSGNYNKKSVCRVAKFYCDHEDSFEKLRLELSECRIEYPPMKLMDMCFWQDGYISDPKHNCT